MMSTLTRYAPTRQTRSRVRAGNQPGANVRRAGEDIPLNAVVLQAGTDSGPPSWASRRPWAEPSSMRAEARVAVLVTGDELTEPGTALAPGRIYSSNAYALAAQVERAGGAVVTRSRFRTTPRAPGGRSAQALEEADVVVVSGGVSVGPARPRQAGASRARRRGALLGRAAPPGQADLVRRSRRYARVRPARATPYRRWSPSSCSRDRRSPRSRARRPTRRASRRGSRSRSGATRSASRPSGSACSRARTAQSRRPTKGAQGSHVLTSMVGADGLALIAPGRGRGGRGRARGGRAPVRPRDPRRLLERHRRARARVTIVHEPQSRDSEEGGAPAAARWPR